MRHRIARLAWTVGTAFALSASAFVAAQIQDTAPAPAPAVEPAKTTPDAVPPRPLGVMKQKAEPKTQATKAVTGTTTTTTTTTAIRPALAPAAMMAADDNMKAMVQQMAQQWSSQFRPFLRVEYQFLRTVCEPTKEQRRPIARAGEEALRDGATKFAEWQLNRNGMIRIGGSAAGPDVRKIVQEGLAASAKAHLSPEQQERYRREVEARAAEQKRLGVLNLVARLDQFLVLSAEQRDRISASLSSHWDDSWSQGIESSNLVDAYFPMIPDQHVAPFLSPAQKTVWAGAQKATHITYGVAGVINAGNGPLDDEFPDEIPGEEPKPEAKP
jgi:hypothetical protein